VFIDVLMYKNIQVDIKSILKFKIISYAQANCYLMHIFILKELYQEFSYETQLFRQKNYTLLHQKC
jgi:hypothetical protein